MGKPYDDVGRQTSIEGRIIIRSGLMEAKNSNVIEINLKELLFILLHKAWLIILIGVIGAVVAGSYSNFLLTPYYTSTAKVYVISRQSDFTTWADLQIGTSLAQDYMILVKSRPVLEEVISKLNMDMPYEELSGMISVYTPTETRVMEITVTYYDALLAKRLVDTVAEISSERMVTVMGIEKVNVVEEGNLPSAPTGPNINRNIKLGAFIGIIISSFIIALVYILNDSIKTSEDIEKYLGMTTLGIIPIEENIKKSKTKKKRSKKKVAYVA